MSYQYWNIKVQIAVELMGMTPVGPIFYYLMLVSCEQRVHASPHLSLYRPCCGLVVMLSDRGEKDQGGLGYIRAFTAFCGIRFFHSLLPTPFNLNNADNFCTLRVVHIYR